MTASQFSRLLVPVQFDTADPAPRGTQTALRIDDDIWIHVSEDTLSALRFAAAFAVDGQVCMVHAMPDFNRTAHYAGSEGAWLQASVTDMTQAARQRATRVLEVLAERYMPGVRTEFTVEPGKPTGVIADAIEGYKPNLIVLAASGRGRAARAVLGSTADKVIRRAPCPIFVVPAGFAAGGGGRPNSEPAP